MALFARIKQRFQRKVEDVQYQAIQLVSVKRSYLERRDKNRFRELVDIPAEITLSEEQVIAATSHAKETLVVAGAGSGKTRVLTYRIAHLMKKGVDSFNILSLTFTNKAAKEMRTRIEKIAGNEAKNLWMGTFHAVFAKILRLEGKRLGYPSNFTISRSR